MKKLLIISLTLLVLSPNYAQSDKRINVIGAPKGIHKKGNLKYSCVECHKHVELNFKKRELKGEHENIKLNHGGNWCYTCHDVKDRSQLRLIDQTKIPFKEMVKQCAQCHGPVYRDWKAGVHGKRIGFWNGKKETYACNHCHDPHAPKFKPMKPFSPPKNRFGIIHKKFHKEASHDSKH